MYEELTRREKMLFVFWSVRWMSKSGGTCELVVGMDVTGLEVAKRVYGKKKFLKNRKIPFPPVL